MFTSMSWSSLLPLGALFGTSFAIECSPSAINAILPSNATVNFAYNLPPNATFQVPKSDTGYPQSPVGLPALCAVSVQVKSIGNSTFGFGLFLPEGWNGRLLAVGNGGFAGGINWADMAPGVRYGFATMSTDTGHNSSSGDGSWAYKSPERLENWGHLAMHGSVVTAKTIVSAYYEKPVSYNYYAGCSTGGRQGLKEAEMYPEDFDGIIAGAPAWWTSHMQPWTVQMGFYNLPTSADYHIPPAKFPLIAKKVLEQCDPQDGLLDTVISDPVGCVFQPEQLHCPTNVTNSTSADCLTSAQISTLYKIYNGSWSEDEALTFPPLYLGAEAQWLLFSMAEPNPLGTDYVRYFLGLGPDWPYTDFNDDIKRLADSTDPGNATVGFDLSAFQAKGGKILSYHGLSDGLIPAGSSVYFYEHVYDLLRTQGIDVDEFFRFFLVPGMGHCQGTPTDVNAPWYFAGANQAPSLGQTAYGVPGFTDKEHDVMLALMAWVEEDTAPTEIIATKYVNDTKHDEVLRQRALCMYPAQAKYTGSGDPNSAGNWKCESPK